MMIALIPAFFIFLTNFFSDALFIKNKIYRFQARSFAAGISLAYVFLHLIPHYSNNSSLFFATILLGFSTLHILERFLFDKYEGKRLRRSLKEEHMTVFFIYHFIAGFALVSLTGSIEGFFFFIPLLLHDLLSNAALRHSYANHFTKLILSSSIIIGVLFGLFIPINTSVLSFLIAFFIGSILHSIFRDLIPNEREGFTLYFILGVLTMIGFLSATFF